MKNVDYETIDVMIKKGPNICCLTTNVYMKASGREQENYRWFRDKMLAVTKFGRRIIHSYYQGMGQQLAYLVMENPKLRYAVKAPLDVGSLLIEIVRAVK